MAYICYISASCFITCSRSISHNYTGLVDELSMNLRTNASNTRKRRYRMKKYDVIVIGSGCGMSIVDEALGHGLKVALVDKGPLGGTCPNLGCIPSKLLIHVADRMLDAADSRRLGLRLDLPVPDFL